MQLSVAAALALLAASAEAFVPIVANTGGVNATTGVRPDRLEINSFASQAGPGWDLYVQCLAQVQARPQSQIDSYYQISGIHGRPYIAWDGVGSAPGSHSGGYCPHSSVLFPTWHRPYLALMEQQIWNCAQTLANSYPTATRSSYVDAAKTLRIPYWDWVKVATLPSVVTTTTISINGPNGRTTITNPLYSYKFSPKPSQSDFPGTGAPVKYTQTVRTPNSQGVSNHNSVNTAMQRNAGYLHDTVYQQLTGTNSYAEFSNNGYAGSADGYGSIENPHGSVHNLVGGNGGHMTYLDYSAFDPIFWLHHTNVDRLIAIWQALHPKSFEINQVNQGGTYSITAGSTDTANTLLGPFHTDNAGNQWTSTTARDTKAFGYTYPELRPWGKTADQYTADVRAKIRALYDPNGALGRRSRIAAPEKLDPRATAPLDPSDIIDGGSYNQWSVNLRVNKFAMQTSFTIYFFLGGSSTGSADYATDPALVGSYPVFRPQGDAPTDKLTIYGTIPLTRALLGLDRKTLPNLKVGPTKSYLRKNLNWKIADANGVDVPVKGLKSLKVYVKDQKVTPPKGKTDFPQYGEITAHVDVTDGKDGSLKEGEPLAANN